MERNGNTIHSFRSTDYADRGNVQTCFVFVSQQMRLVDGADIRTASFCFRHLKRVASPSLSLLFFIFSFPAFVFVRLVCKTFERYSKLLKAVFDDVVVFDLENVLLGFRFIFVLFCSGCFVCLFVCFCLFVVVLLSY